MCHDVLQTVFDWDILLTEYEKEWSNNKTSPWTFRLWNVHFSVVQLRLITIFFHYPHTRPEAAKWKRTTKNQRSVCVCMGKVLRFLVLFGSRIVGLSLRVSYCWRSSEWRRRNARVNTHKQWPFEYINMKRTTQE